MSKRPTLDQVLAGADRATERVKRWPNWMLELSPDTAHLVKDEPMSEQSEPKCVVCRERPVAPALDFDTYMCSQCTGQSWPDSWWPMAGGAKKAWAFADKQIAALQARIAELEAQLANTLEARTAQTKQPWTGRELLEYAAKHADLFTREDFDCILEDVKGCTFSPELTVAVCKKCLHPVCECKPAEIHHNLLVLDEYGCAVPFEGDTKEWEALLDVSRQVARTKIGESLVSTVFLGMPHDGGPFETLIFGGFLDGDGKRYETIEQARRGHELWCERVRQA